jgi:glucose/arabinose dehydrogenase
MMRAAGYVFVGGALLGAAVACSTSSQTASEPGAAIDAPASAAPATAAKTGTKGPATSGRITRRDEVPDGVTTPSGLTVPRGFQVNIFAGGLDNPRRITFAPGATPQKYDVFVAESRPNRIRVLREFNGDGKADQRFVFAEGLSQPYRIAFHPSGWVYVANTDAVVRFPYRAGATSASGKSQFISKLTEGGYNQHWTRNLLFSRDAKKLYVTVGSACNTCEEDDPQRAAISVMNPDGKDRRLFATGLRNPVGMAWRPGTTELWTVVNERDRLGDDVPPDYLTLVSDGAFYGWPYAYVDLDGKVIPDPEYGERNPQKVRQTRPWTVPVQAHSAALGVAFYPQETVSGAKAFPSEFSGDAFLAYHGSWNRSAKTGYKIVRVDFQNGRPKAVTDFVRGFQNGDKVWGRPVDVQIAPDGSLLFTDDDGGKIWRVSRAG